MRPPRVNRGGRVLDQVADTRTEILNVALRLFRTQGYAATSLRQIAESVQVSKAAVYYHFRAKQDIIVALTGPFLAGLEELIQGAPVSAPSARSRRELLAAYLDLLLHQHDVVNLLAGDPSTMNPPKVGLRLAALMTDLRARLAAGTGEEAGIRVGCAFAAISAAANLPVAEARQHRATILQAALAALGRG